MKILLSMTMLIGAALAFSVFHVAALLLVLVVATVVPLVDLTRWLGHLLVRMAWRRRAARSA